MSKMTEAIGKSSFVRFCLVGGVSTLLNYSVFFFLLTFFGIDYMISSAAGYISGVFLGFGLNRSFTFGSQSKKYFQDITKYFIIYTISLFLGLGFLRLLVYFGVVVLLANVLSIGLTTITNYTGVKYAVFQQKWLKKKTDYWIYRYRYLLNYTLIGLGSIIIEVVALFLMNYQGFFPILFFAFFLGMVFSFVLNSRLNFRVPKERNFRTFKLFALISIFAFSLNLVLIDLLKSIVTFDYSAMRFVSAGTIFPGKLYSASQDYFLPY